MSGYESTTFVSVYLYLCKSWADKDDQSYIVQVDVDLLQGLVQALVCAAAELQQSSTPQLPEQLWPY